MLSRLVRATFVELLLPLSNELERPAIVDGRPCTEPLASHDRNSFGVLATSAHAIHVLSTRGFVADALATRDVAVASNSNHQHPPGPALV